MGYRTRIRYTESQKSQMWDRWQQGESLHQIARLFDRHHTSVRQILAESGGIRPRQRCRSPHALSLVEREEISRAVVRGLLASSCADALKQVATDAHYLRLLHRGSMLRTSLGALWKAQGGYQGAENAVRTALLQEHFATAQKDWRGIHLMTIHKSKGKEFDEVIIYDGMFQRIARKPDDQKACAQDLLALRVEITRAIRRASILTPRNAPCPFL